MTPVKPTISEEAAQWAVRLHQGSLTPQEQGELDAWVAADVRHEGALVRARAAWLDLDRLAALGAGRLPIAQPRSEPQLQPQAQDKAHDNQEQDHVRRRPAGFFLDHRRILTTLATLAAGLAAVSILATAWFLAYTPGDTFVSGVGELRKVPLADGSTMLLNTSTTASVEFDNGQRNVRLAAGEALFEVAKDPARPFVVRTGKITVTAVGTAFAVRKEADGRVEVTVTEGVVEIERSDGTQDIQRVRANQRVMVSGNEPIRVESTLPREAERRLAWRAGMIAFDNEGLGAAIAEFNRYSPRQIVIDDAALAARPITGIFRTTDIDEFAETVATALNADLLNEGETIHIRPR
jgi:transmembrane sensor